jgi:hypothetical protein
MKVEVSMGWQWVWAMGLVALVAGAAWSEDMGGIRPVPKGGQPVAVEDQGLKIAKRTKTANGSIESTIQEVTEGGTIVLERGITLRQWAVTFTDIHAANNFLKGKRAYCLQVLLDSPSRRSMAYEGYIGVFDCSVSPYSKGALTPRYALLNVYAWAEELGFGKAECSIADKMPEDTIGISHVAGFYYACDNEQSSKQQFAVSEQSHE